MAKLDKKKANLSISSQLLYLFLAFSFFGERERVCLLGRTRRYAINIEKEKWESERDRVLGR